MTRGRLHAPNPESARKRIKVAKSNQRFMTALLDRGHGEHGEALEHWTALHEVAFREPAVRSSNLLRGEARHGETSSVLAPADTEFNRQEKAREVDAPSRTPVRRRSSANRSSREGRTHGLPTKQRSRDEATARAQGPDRPDLPDPERPLGVDQRAISPFLRRRGESESDWLERLEIAIGDAQRSVDRLAIIREAILREIGFYDVGSGPAASDGALRDSDWRVLAALQNVPIDGWERAQQLGVAQTDFEQRGTLGPFEAIGPDGNIYHRLSISGSNPVGDTLRTIDGRIRLLQPPPPPGQDVMSTLALGAVPRAERRGGTPVRSPLTTNVAPQVLRVIRSRQGAAALGLGLGMAGGVAAQRRSRVNMDPAPDMPPSPGFEPPEGPETERESLPADLPPIPPLPGFMPEDYGDLVEIFPDQRGELPLVAILDNRLGNERTQLFNTTTMRRVRDFAEAIGVALIHRGGGRPDNESGYEKELWLPAGGEGGGTAGSSYLDIAFESPRTKRKLLINTIDTRADNVTPTTREERAAVRILVNSNTGDILILLPKPPRGQEYDLDRFLEWLRPHLEEIDRELPEGSEGHQRRFDFH